jgi:hypothetical protein
MLPRGTNEIAALILVPLRKYVAQIVINDAISHSQDIARQISQESRYRVTRLNAQ